MKAIGSFFILAVCQVCVAAGETNIIAVSEWSEPVSLAEERRMQDGKLLYELGRSDEAHNQLQLLLVETSDQRLRTYATYYLDRIEIRLVPETSDLRVPHSSDHEHFAGRTT